MAKVNFKMIVLARESRGKSQKELAQKTNIPQSHLSRIEHGDVHNLKHELLQLIAKALDYPESFFYQEYDIYPPNIHYRKRVSVDVRTLLKADAQMNIYRFNIQEMLKSIDLETRNIPIATDQYPDPIRMASYLRSYWKVPAGPINDLSKLVEDNGIIVIQMDFETEKIDGRSIMTNTGHPIIFINQNSSGDRQRLTLAHELGHIILHMNTIPLTGRDEEDEAFLFASEFLMPTEDVAHQLRGRLTLEKLADLKRFWRISMAAILLKAQKNDSVGYNQARYLWTQFNAQGIRRNEPIEIPQEVPTLAGKMIGLLMTELNYDKEDISVMFKLKVEELEAKFFARKNSKLRLA